LASYLSRLASSLERAATHPASPTGTRPASQPAEQHRRRQRGLPTAFAQQRGSSQQQSSRSSSRSSSSNNNNNKAVDLSGVLQVLLLPRLLLLNSLGVGELKGKMMRCALSEEPWHHQAPGGLLLVRLLRLHRRMRLLRPLSSCCRGCC
jgi:hypothetical protein